MNLSRTLKLTAAVAVCTAAAAQSALAGGEPKNQTPFTSPVTTLRAPAAVITASAIASARIMIAGEPKNETPFTRPVGTDALTRYLHRSSRLSANFGLGEAKNQDPFTRRVG